MKHFLSLLLFIYIGLNTSIAQHTFDYNVKLNAITIDNLPGLHSFAFAQHDGKWLIIGGRTDGLHARQPFAAFPNTDNNTNIYVADVNTKQVWKASLSGLPTNILEQLQSTNMNFHQIEDTLYVVGGYCIVDKWRT